MERFILEGKKKRVVFNSQAEMVLVKRVHIFFALCILEMCLKRYEKWYLPPVESIQRNPPTAAIFTFTVNYLLSVEKTLK